MSSLRQISIPKPSSNFPFTSPHNNLTNSQFYDNFGTHAVMSMDYGSLFVTKTKFLTSLSTSNETTTQSASFSASGGGWGIKVTATASTSSSESSFNSNSSSFSDE
ncbi:MAG: MAC/perforin domain-containing protein [Anaerolineales bacterium]|nr:MAC/perforin domain-containing protein [Anaerolineales bacterium]